LFFSFFLLTVLSFAVLILLFSLPHCSTSIP
jgi:hypothetical protein